MARRVVRETQKKQKPPEPVIEAKPDRHRQFHGDDARTIRIPLTPRVYEAYMLDLDEIKAQCETEEDIKRVDERAARIRRVWEKLGGAQ